MPKIIYLTFFCKSIKEYELFYINRSKFQIDQCLYCGQKNPGLKKHSYYYPSYQDFGMIVFQCPQCKKTKVLFPSFVIDKKIDSLEKKVEVAKSYINSDETYRSLAKKHSLSKSGIYRTVKKYSASNNQILIKEVSQQAPELDIIARIPKTLPFFKPARKPETFNQLLNSYQAMKLFSICRKVWAARLRTSKIPKADQWMVIQEKLFSLMKGYAVKLIKLPNGLGQEIMYDSS